MHEHGWDSFVHHANAESLRSALELPCALCIRIWSNPKGKNLESVPRRQLTDHSRA
jgi:hypothetical protein